jgi:hypothetical protein
LTAKGGAKRVKKLQLFLRHAIVVDGQPSVATLGWWNIGASRLPLKERRFETAVVLGSAVANRRSLFAS